MEKRRVWSSWASPTLVTASRMASTNITFDHWHPVRSVLSGVRASSYKGGVHRVMVFSVMLVQTNCTLLLHILVYII